MRADHPFDNPAPWVGPPSLEANQEQKNSVQKMQACFALFCVRG